MLAYEPRLVANGSYSGHDLTVSDFDHRRFLDLYIVCPPRRVSLKLRDEQIVSCEVGYQIRRAPPASTMWRFVKKNLSVEETTAVILSRAYTEHPDDAGGALLI